MSTLPSIGSKRTLCGDRETIQLTPDPKDWISIDSKINCQQNYVNYFVYSQGLAYSCLLLIVTDSVHVGGPGHLHGVARLYLGYLVTTH